MSLQFKVGDPVWVNGTGEGEITRLDSSDSSLPCLVCDGFNSYWVNPSQLTPRIVRPDPIESAVSVMATEPTSRSSGWTVQWLNMAIEMLSLSVTDYHKLLGEDYPAKAIEAALPLLRNVRDELD